MRYVAEAVLVLALLGIVFRGFDAAIEKDTIGIEQKLKQDIKPPTLGNKDFSIDSSICNTINYESIRCNNFHFSSGGGLTFYDDGRIIWKDREITKDRDLVEALEAVLEGKCINCKGDSK